MLNCFPPSRKTKKKLGGHGVVTFRDSDAGNIKLLMGFILFNQSWHARAHLIEMYRSRFILGRSMFRIFYSFALTHSSIRLLYIVAFQHMRRGRNDKRISRNIS